MDRSDRRSLVVVAVVLLLGGITADRLRDWRDERQLWAVDTDDRKPRHWVNLGKQYDLKGDLVAAAAAYEQAITLTQDPSRSRDEQIGGRALAEANLALVRWKQGDRTTAGYLIDTAAARAPWNPDIHGLQAWIQSTR